MGLTYIWGLGNNISKEAIMEYRISVSPLEGKMIQRCSLLAQNKSSVP